MARAANLRREDRAIARVAISNVRKDLLRQAIPRAHRHSPGRKYRMQQRREAPPSRMLAAWRRFPRAGQLPKQLLWDHKLACHASSMLPRMAPESARPAVTAPTIPLSTSKEPQAK